MINLKFINIWHSSQNHLKTGDFRKKQEDGSCHFKTGAFRSKRESCNICWLVQNLLERFPKGRGVVTTSRKSMMEHFRGNRQRLQTINYFRQKVHRKCWPCSNFASETFLILVARIPKFLGPRAGSHVFIMPTFEDGWAKRFLKTCYLLETL